MDAASLPRERPAGDSSDQLLPLSGDPADATRREVGGLLAPPNWLRALGTSAWLIVGVALVTVAAIWLLALTQTIVMPVIAAGVVAAVMSPVVAWMKRRGV